MQIFNDKTFVTGIEYRDAEGNPREGSIIIDDASAEAQAILAGADFDLTEDGVSVKQGQKREDAKRAEKVAAREEKRKEKRMITLAAIIEKSKAKENLTAKELQDAVDILIDAVFSPDEE